jgi:hypothetical protein
MARYHLEIGEIEHDGDEQRAITELFAGGARDIKVVQRDHEGSESIIVVFAYEGTLNEMRKKLSDGGVCC